MDQSALRRFGFWDLVLYGTALMMSLRWLATAAAAGPASLPIWILAALFFLGPLTIASAELTGRYSGEGSIYAWTRETFGPFAGFVCAWLYWTCNLPFFAGLFLFIANVLALAAGPEAANLIHSPLVFLSVSIALCALIALMHAAGIGVGKWLPNFGAISTFAVLAVLLMCGALLAATGRVATDFSDARAYAPPFNADGAILWATMVFAFGGAEGVAIMRNEVAGGMRTVVRSLAMVGVMLVLLYVFGSAAMLTILEPAQATRLGGMPEALMASFEKLGIGAFAPSALILVALAMLGSLSAWFGVAARLPFAVGVGHALPEAFGRRDPKCGAPVFAIYLQAGLVIALLILSQAGGTLESAYDFLVAMTVLSYTLPFLFLFAAYWRAQDRPAPADIWDTPGGAGRAKIIAAIGFLTTTSAIVCSLTPSPSSTDPLGEFGKLVLASAVLIGAGVLAYLASRARSASEPKA